MRILNISFLNRRFPIVFLFAMLTMSQLRISALSITTVCRKRWNWVSKNLHPKKLEAVFAQCFLSGDSRQAFNLVTSWSESLLPRILTKNMIQSFLYHFYHGCPKIKGPLNHEHFLFNTTRVKFYLIANYFFSRRTVNGWVIYFLNSDSILFAILGILKMALK